MPDATTTVLASPAAPLLGPPLAAMLPALCTLLLVDNVPPPAIVRRVGGGLEALVAVGEVDVVMVAELILPL